ncbi:hypothetical protein FANTH_7519 [Fusarium anthophilum]|uniref:Uncharacterized protein n=1 Tax=Fusarium anthophilum TaxID=48485 RepID=A0A8H4ZEM9_9HYPO|nr:hypothetical protein FANTH_7519 [Fusarium anthophilum]
MQLGSGEYQGRQHQAPRAPSFNEDQGQQQHVNFQQLPRQDPGLQAPHNANQSQQQQLNYQLALPQAPILRGPSNQTHTELQHVTQHAPPPQAPYPQLPSDETLDYSMQLSNLPQFFMTPTEFLSTAASSISQQRLDTTQPQPQRYPTETGFSIFSDPPQSNIISPENPSTVIGSMGQQNIGDPQPRHDEHPLLDSLDPSQLSSVENFFEDYATSYFDENNNDTFSDMDNQEEVNGTDLIDMGNYYQDYNSDSLDSTSNDPSPDTDIQEEDNGTDPMDTVN